MTLFSFFFWLDNVFSTSVVLMSKELWLAALIVVRFRSTLKSKIWSSTSFFFSFYLKFFESDFVRSSCFVWFRWFSWLDWWLTRRWSTVILTCVNNDRDNRRRFFLHCRNFRQNIICDLRNDLFIWLYIAIAC